MEGICPHALREAADWLVRLNDEAVGDADRDAWKQWLGHSDAHAVAWARAERLAGLIGSVPSGVGSASLRHGRMHDRRQALRTLAFAFGAVSLSGWAIRERPWTGLLADYTTGNGERRDIHLDDDGVVSLNTDSALDVRTGADGVVLSLHRGEAMSRPLQVAASHMRPLLLETRHGEVLAHRARFALRLFDDHARLSVVEGSVEAWPRHLGDAPRMVSGGQQLRFGAAHVEPTTSLLPHAVSWVDGVLRAESMPMADLIAELARYRRGMVRCDPEVAAIPVSGLFQLADPDKALRLLAEAFPVRLQYRSHLWVTVSPR